jgi:hypothetical protein
MSLPSRDPVAGFFDFGEKGGIAAPGTDVFAPFTGFSMGPGVRGATVPLGTALGDGASTYRKSNMWGFDQDNGAIVMQYVSSHKSVDLLREDTGVGHLLYASNPRMRRHLQAKEVKAARKEDPTFYGAREPLEFKCLSRLNRWLRSKEGRVQFGKDRDSARLRATFKLAGAQIGKVPDHLGSADEFVVAVAVGRRARIKDLTLIDGKGAQMNDVVFVVWRRFKFEGVPLPSKVLHAPAKIDKSFAERELKRAEAAIGVAEEVDSDSDSEDLLERVRAMKQADKGPDVIKKALKIKKAILEPGVAADKGEDEYYWRGDIWYGPRGTRPNEALFLPDNGSFIGDVDFVGYVFDRYGDRSQTLVNQAHAKEALHPSNDSDDWKKAFVALPDLEVHLRIR